MENSIGLLGLDNKHDSYKKMICPKAAEKQLGGYRRKIFDLIMIITLFVRLRSLTFSVITHNSLPLAVAKMLPENKYN